MRKVTITTQFGSIMIEYESSDELNERLDGAVQDVQRIQAEVEGIVPRAQRQPKPGLEHVYGFTPSGVVELFHYPATGIAKSILALYAYHPQPVTADELEAVTGITSIKSKVLGQTLNKQYFRTEDDAFGLTSEGIQYFEENIRATLRPSDQQDLE